ncbi:MAG: hypothetical protein HQ465_12455 [Rhodospirillales bacterium]|nr:hypothetical protein [Rhodospirillales bacterium]
MLLRRRTWSRLRGCNIVLFAVFAATMANSAVFATPGPFGREVGLGEAS